MADQELQLQRKQEADKPHEPTRPTRTFIPVADIFETEEALTVILEMAGVDRQNVDVNVEDAILTIEGEIDFEKYQDLQPVYGEYNVGNFRRSFRLPAQIDQGKITAEMRDGVITLVLPKAEGVKPRQIEVKA